MRNFLLGAKPRWVHLASHIRRGLVGYWKRSRRRGGAVVPDHNLRSNRMAIERGGGVMRECLVSPLVSRVTDTGRWQRDLIDADDPALCGGKAAGLARLLNAGFPVPSGICLTTDFSRAALAQTDVPARVAALVDGCRLDAQSRRERLAELRQIVETVPLPADVVDVIEDGVKSLRTRWDGMLAVRSSAVLEDQPAASHAGIHVTFIGHYDFNTVVGRVKACWASLWSERAWAYRERVRIRHADAAMAVVLQRFVAGGRAGVAFSADPMTGDTTTVVIEAAWGSGEAVVGGTVIPEHYRVGIGEDRSTFVVSEPASTGRPVLTGAEARTLAQLVKRVERALGAAADVEWTYDGHTFWIVQARAIGHRGRRDRTLWTRANLKEVFPDQPSPLALSYLPVALNGMFREYHAAQGYELPADASLVGVFNGRPYLNLSLMNHMTVVRGGKPEIVTRLFGGAPPPESSDSSASPSASSSALRVGQVARLARELLATVFLTPRRAQRLFRKIRRQARGYAAIPLEQLDDAAVNAHLARFARDLVHPSTLRRLHEIVSAQSRAYMILERLLGAWVPSKADRLLTQLMTGLGTLPNARLTYRLMALSAVAHTEPRVEGFLSRATDSRALQQYRSTLAGTRFLADLDHLLREFGHRGPFESDVMSPRFVEDPEPLLRIVYAYLRSPTLESPDRHEAERQRIRQAARDEARCALRAGRSWPTFVLQWGLLSIVCAALQRLLAQRDENRHVTKLLVAHLRRLALEIGRRAQRAGRLATAADIFFVSWEELPAVLADVDRDWRSVVSERRQERLRDALVPAPDLLGGEEPAEDDASRSSERHELRQGLGVSPGTVVGTVKIATSAADLHTLGGEIVVMPAIEPSLASIFPIVGGLVAEMGGILSHVAILAREYGLPAVVNVKNATRSLRDGDRIELNGTTGRIRVLGRRLGADNGVSAVAEDHRGNDQADQRARDHV